MMPTGDIKVHTGTDPSVYLKQIVYFAVKNK